MKLYPQTSPDSVQAWTQEDFGYAVDTKAGLESALETIFPACSPAPASSASACQATSSSFTELKPVPPLKALTQCDFVGSSAEAAAASGSGGGYYSPSEPGPGAQDLVSTTTVVMGELAAESVMMKPAEPAVLDQFLPSDMAEDDFAAIIGNAMSDPQLVVPDSLELGSFTSSDMHDLEAWIEGQSQARLQRLHGAAAAAAAVAASQQPGIAPGHVTLQYGTASPMLQNLLAANECGMAFGGMSRALTSAPAGYSGLLANSALQHRLQKPLLTYSPPSYSSIADGMPTHGGDGIGGAKKRRPISRSTIKMPIATEGTKDRPVHRCTICNRGFLNKSNIKVHLRTHTGEKPFKCETCNKAFRQKAHLLKHYHIHKRMTRD